MKGDERLLKIKNTVARLPPPHYRTAKFLFAHLNRMSLYSAKTGMDSRNLAIVWSPNLMRFVCHIYVIDEICQLLLWSVFSKRRTGIRLGLMQLAQPIL